MTVVERVILGNNARSAHPARLPLPAGPQNGRAARFGLLTLENLFSHYIINSAKKKRCRGTLMLEERHESTGYQLWFQFTEVSADRHGRRGRSVCKGLCERIGIEGSKIVHKAHGKEWEEECPSPPTRKPL